MGWLGGIQGHRQCHHSIERYDFLFVFNKNYAFIFYRFRDTASYLSKFANFDLPSLGVTPFEFQKDFWHQKTRVIMRRCLCHPTFALLLEHRLVTD